MINFKISRLHENFQNENYKVGTPDVKINALCQYCLFVKSSGFGSSIPTRKLNIMAPSTSVRACSPYILIKKSRLVSITAHQWCHLNKCCHAMYVYPPNHGVNIIYFMVDHQNL